MDCKHIGKFRCLQLLHVSCRRRGDEFTVPLCEWHHRSVALRFGNAKSAETLLGPSLALNPRRFREVFGSDDDLLAEANRLIQAHAARTPLN